MGLTSTYQLFNMFIHPVLEEDPEILGIVHDKDIRPGEVFLVTGKHPGGIVTGELLEGPGGFRNKEQVFQTRKIELSAPLRMYRMYLYDPSLKLTLG